MVYKQNIRHVDMAIGVDPEEELENIRVNPEEKNYPNPDTRAYRLYCCYNKKETRQ